MGTENQTMTIEEAISFIRDVEWEGRLFRKEEDLLSNDVNFRLSTVHGLHLQFEDIREDLSTASKIFYKVGDPGKGENLVVKSVRLSN